MNRQNHSCKADRRRGKAVVCALSGSAHSRIASLRRIRRTSAYSNIAQVGLSPSVSFVAIGTVGCATSLDQAAGSRSRLTFAAVRGQLHVGKIVTKASKDSEGDSPLAQCLVPPMTLVRAKFAESAWLSGIIPTRSTLLTVHRRPPGPIVEGIDWPTTGPQTRGPECRHDGDVPRGRGSHATGSAGLYWSESVYTDGVSKHLIDIDEEALRAARAELGTGTIKETVNRALRRAGGSDGSRVKRSLDVLARAELAAREDAWR